VQTLWRDAMLAIDGAGNWHVASSRYLDGAALFVHSVRAAANGQWSTTTVDTGAGTEWMGVWNDIAVDVAGNVHVVYTVVPTSEDERGTLHYARRAAGGTFATPIPLDAETKVQQVAIAADPSGAVHVLYRDVVEADVRYLRRSPTGVWSQPEVVDAEGGVGLDIFMKVDDAGTLHAIWIDETDNQLVYSQRCTSPAD
jgi:hypothetical protein